MTSAARRGTLRVGTSGFAYPAWIPAFYPPGSKPDSLLRLYASRLPACELNGTYYRQPTESQIDGWLASTPDDFHFSVKAHAAGSRKALSDPGVLSWLLRPMARFGARLGSVLFRVPEVVARDDARLAAFLAAWPAQIPLTVEFRHPTWLVDEVFDLLAGSNVVLCATELDTDPEPPRIHVTGSFLYLRLRREEYAAEELDAWAARLVPFLEDGRDIYVFFRHDAVGRAPGRALALAARLETIDTTSPAPARGARLTVQR